MINQNLFDEIAKKIMAKLPSELRESKAGIEKNINHAISTVIGKLDLVSREELEAQNKVLARCEQQIEDLESRINELTRQLEHHDS